MTSYMMNLELFDPQMSWRDVIDGLSNTALFVEGYGECGSLGGKFRSNTLCMGNEGISFYSHELVRAPLNRGFTGSTDFTKTLDLPIGNLPPGVKASASVFQDRPLPANCDADLPQSIRRGLILVLRCDGSVNGFTRSVNALTWRAIFTPNASDPPAE